MRLLIIGNLGGQIGSATLIASKRGAKVRQVNDINAALEMLRNGSGADLLMVDVKLDIKDLCQRLELEKIFIPVVGCGVNNTKEEAVNAINSGAKEYLPLPANDELIAAVFEAISADDTRSIIFSSPKMKQIADMALRVAKSDATILITGKSGSGKEVMSRYIYQNSNRTHMPFIAVNCAAIPENLIESELFGHEKGAFTGAIARRIGKFEESNNGTLLLDEISEIDIKLQAKLLRVLQEQEVERIGGAGRIKLNLRIIATSNRDLKKEVQEGRFREDLFFRLNIINLKLPNLNERKEDLILFCNYFIKKYSKSNGIAIKALSNEAIKTINEYSWPGNVRELENTLYRAVLLARGDKIEAEDLMLSLNQTLDSTKTSPLVGRTFDSVEKELILSTLDHCLGNRINAANILGITIKDLKEKLENYDKQTV